MEGVHKSGVSKLPGLRCNSKRVPPMPAEPICSTFCVADPPPDLLTLSQAVVLGLFSTFVCGTLRPSRRHMMIDFKNLIVGRHESRVLFTWNLENGGAVLGAFLGIKDGIETILARDGITPALRTVLEEFRAIARENNWDFAALRSATG